MKRTGAEQVGVRGMDKVEVGAIDDQRFFDRNDSGS